MINAPKGLICSRRIKTKCIKVFWYQTFSIGHNRFHQPLSELFSDSLILPPTAGAWKLEEF